jgi:F420-non-reducing hydrogenase iron-sulfur subunit
VHCGDSERNAIYHKANNGGGKPITSFEPKILVFRCNWSSDTGAGSTGTSMLKARPYLRAILTMCSGRIEPVFILRAFAEDIDGVMIIGCPPGDCHYNTGNYMARRRVLALKHMLSQFGIEPERVRLELISASEEAKLQSTINEFIDEVTVLGPLKVRDKVAVY